MDADDWINAHDPLEMIELLCQRAEDRPQEEPDFLSRLVSYTLCCLRGIGANQEAEIVVNVARRVYSPHEFVELQSQLGERARRTTGGANSVGKHPRRIPLDAQRARATLHAILFPPRAAAASVTGDTLHQLQREQCEWLRCLFPNPLREIHIRPAWRTSTVMELARGIASDRAFDRLPILADALQDADCNDPDLLYHCRHGKAHLPECWAVRAVLGLPEERAEEAMGDS